MESCLLVPKLSSIQYVSWGQTVSNRVLMHTGTSPTNWCCILVRSIVGMKVIWINEGVEGRTDSEEGRREGEAVRGRVGERKRERKGVHSYLVILCHLIWNIHFHNEKIYYLFSNG